MGKLEGKKILLIITGSIAAYKSAFLTRLMIKEGAEVRIVMTPASCEFITPLTLSTLSKNPVMVDMMSENEWNSHVDLGLWADVLLLAPATANTMAKMANGIADNLALTSYLSAKCPVIIAPAMDLDMWKHLATQKNLETLMSYGHNIIPVGEGELASGLRGEGRMAEPEKIITFLDEFFSKKKISKDLKGKKVLITAGPTYEAIDPVRYIGNHSSGKMGVALANECYERGASVVLVLGPSKETPIKGIELIQVKDAESMAQSVLTRKDQMDLFIFAAAVADFTPYSYSSVKIKKKDEDFVLRLKRTTDIAAKVGEGKKPGQVLIGFALESNDEMSNAKRKLKKKNFDLIILNSLQDKGAGFKHDTNKISIISKDNKIKEFELKSKRDVASDIIDSVVNIL